MNKQFCCLDKLNFYEMCSYCYNAYFTDPDFEVQMYEDYKSEPKVSSANAKCECGGSSVSDVTHSVWCPLFRDDGGYYGTD